EKFLMSAVILNKHGNTPLASVFNQFIEKLNIAVTKSCGEVLYYYHLLRNHALFLSFRGSIVFLHTGKSCSFLRHQSQISVQSLKTLRDILIVQVQRCILIYISCDLSV